MHSLTGSLSLISTELQYMCQRRLRNGSGYLVAVGRWNSVLLCIEEWGLFVSGHVRDSLGLIHTSPQKPSC